MDFTSHLEQVVDREARRLATVSDDVAARRPAPNKWSMKEIVGHLIDSAANNHQRFVRARWQDDLVFVGYDQDAWVESQHYHDAPWADLVELWRAYNRHLARVMRGVPAELRTRLHARHNLHQIAFRTVPADRPTTLEYLMSDYVAHLEHHLLQIEALRRAAAGGA